MSWVVDTCMILDVLTGNSVFAEASAALIDKLYPEGLTLCPVTYIELAPAFLGVKRRQDDFLTGIGVNYSTPWTMEDTLQAHKAWARHIEMKREGVAVKRPIADVLIGAFAVRRMGLITRNTKDFTTIYPNLRIITP